VIKFFIFSSNVLSVFCRSKLTANVQQLGEVAVFQHQAFANIIINILS